MYIHKKYAQVLEYFREPRVYFPPYGQKPRPTNVATIDLIWSFIHINKA